HDIIIERSINGVDFTVAGQVSGWDVCYGSGNRGYFVDSNLLPATSYTYRVKAKSAAGESAPSATISFTTPAACAQTIPENRSWSAINSGTESYSLLGSPVNVGIKHLGGGKYEISDLSLSLTGTSQKWTFYESCGNTLVGKPGEINPNGLGTWNGTTLKIKWRACFDGKTETISLTLNPTDPAPAKPLALYAYVVSNTSIEVKWPTSYYEKSYILERSSVSAVSGFSQVANVPFPGTTYIDNGPLTEGTTYYYRLKALNGNATPDASPYSDVVTVPFKKPNFIVANNAITSYNASATIGSFWADFNNDGLEDYFTMQYDDVNQLAKPMIFKNLGGGNYEQILVSLGDGAYFLPSVADYDNDHFPDIAFNGDQARLLDIFKGNGDFTFTKVPSAQLGDLAVIEKTISYTSWADINNDGLADMLILNDEDGSISLFKQNADHSFTKKFQSGPTTNESVLAIWADYDNNGFQDVFIGNTNGAVALYKNNGDETFTLTTGNGLDATNLFSAAWGDYNNDGNIDLYCGSTAANALYKNNGDGTFTKDASTLISEANFATSASWGDYNNDGYLDLMTVSLPFNGSQSRLFLRDPSVTGSVSFKKITTEKINDLSVSHYTVANADPDQNGLLDLEMSAFIFDNSGDGLHAANANFYQNNNLPGNWVEVKLNPAAGKSTEALGAKITLNAGGNTQTRQLASVSSLVSRNSLVAHFGLGSATSITNIQVKWPNGSVQNYPLAPVNQIVVIDEDVQGPAITSKIPVHNATLVEPNTTITIVFDENSFPVSGKTIVLRKTGTTTAIATIDVTTGTKTGNQFVFNLPVTLDGETEYSVLMDAGAFRDRYANPTAAINAGEWRFTTKVVPDVTPPVIAYTSPGTVAKGFSAASQSIPVTDNKAVNTVVVHIRN
ncbi:MAG TPA: FG-GAP-like repeat-containing protein, partial [Chryseosolibacter sp.]